MLYTGETTYNSFRMLLGIQICLFEVLSSTTDNVECRMRSNLKLITALCFNWRLHSFSQQKWACMYVTSATCFDLTSGLHQTLHTVQNIRQFYTIGSAWWKPDVRSKHVALITYIQAQLCWWTFFYSSEVNYGWFLPINPLTPNDIYMSYRTANLQTLHFIYLVNKYTYWIF
jgi:hypothetical protein